MNIYISPWCRGFFNCGNKVNNLPGGNFSPEMAIFGGQVGILYRYSVIFSH